MARCTTVLSCAPSDADLTLCRVFYLVFVLFFFFSSRRRHTRLTCDWSSDVCSSDLPHALANGVTTLIGGGTGPADGSKGTTCTPGPWNMARMLEASAVLPVNVGLLGRGSSGRPEALQKQLEAGACGLKVHEDWGATPAAIDCALAVADEYDVQGALHADTPKESGYLAQTIDAINGRTIHSYHTEGAGGGHAPDMMAIAS